MQHEGSNTTLRVRNPAGARAMTGEHKPDSILVGCLRKAIGQMEVPAPASISASAKLGVIIDYGNSDVGSCTENEVTEEIADLDQAVATLAEKREVVLQEFLEEVGKIHSGIEDGHLVDDGSGQFFIAQIVTSGEYDAIVPIAGVAVWWHPENLHSLEIYEWDEADDWNERF